MEQTQNRNATKKFKRRSIASEVWRRLKKNKGAMVGLFITLLLIAMALTAPLLLDYEKDVIAQHIQERLQGPSLQHPFGTDDTGRDILSRIIYGSRFSLSVGFVAVSVSLLIAPSFVRVTRASVLTVRNQEYIEASRAIGVKDLKIIFRHVLPNSLSPIIVQATMRVGSAIITASTLSFLGMGVSPPTPEWGAMLSSGRKFIRDYSYMTLFPGVAIMITVLALNMFGDGLRDAIDPRLKR